MDVAGKRITVMGLGRCGGALGAIRHLVRCGGEVTVTDCCDEHLLAPSLAKLRDLSLAGLHLGGHREGDFRSAEIVVANPSVKPDHPLLRIAAQSGAQITTELELFLNLCPAKMIGVTGTVGKSTTAAMLADIINASGRTCYVGGNIGGSMLDHLQELQVEDWVVLEMSSFQLARINACSKKLAAAVITNCLPHHLSWHGSYQHYSRSKQSILRLLDDRGIAIFDQSQQSLKDWRPLVQNLPIPPLSDEQIPQLLIAGDHNRRNAALAGSTAKSIGCSSTAVALGLGRFKGLPHRLQIVKQNLAVVFYNDSMATTPISTAAALQSLGKEGIPAVWLLAGGVEQGEDYAPLIGQLKHFGYGAAFFGQSRHRLSWLASVAKIPNIALDTLDQAFLWSIEQCRSGDVVLLSPACASHDQFVNYAHRGEAFIKLVDEWSRSGCLV